MQTPRSALLLSSVLCPEDYSSVSRNKFRLTPSLTREGSRVSRFAQYLLQSKHITPRETRNPSALLPRTRGDTAHIAPHRVRNIAFERTYHACKASISLRVKRGIPPPSFLSRAATPRISLRTVCGISRSKEHITLAKQAYHSA